MDVTLNQKLDFITSGLSVKLKGAYNNDYIVNKKRTSGVPTYTPIILADGSIQLQKMVMRESLTIVKIVMREGEVVLLVTGIRN